MSESNSTVAPAPKRKLTSSGCLLGGILIAILFLLCGVCLGPINPGIKQARHNAAMQQGRQIGQAMFDYATDNVQNGNAYPDGNSSTEVFQKLLDGGYATDPAIFYIPLLARPNPLAARN